MLRITPKYITSANLGMIPSRTSRRVASGKLYISVNFLCPLSMTGNIIRIC